MFECKNCKKDISHKPSNRRIFCSYKCFAEWSKLNHPNRKKEKRVCVNCLKDFDCTAGSKKKFCGNSCAATFNNKIRDKQIYENVSLLNKNAYKNGKLSGLVKGRKKCKLVEKTCPVCKNTYYIKPWENNAGMKKFCSKICSQKRPGQGGYRTGSVRNYKSGWHISPIAGKVWLDSSYEFVVAEYMDEKQYKWIKNRKGFPYVKVNGKPANYFPDFHIEDLDLWVETKGYMTKDDVEKIKYFPYKIVLIGKKIIYDKTQWGF